MAKAIAGHNLISSLRMLVVAQQKGNREQKIVYLPISREVNILQKLINKLSFCSALEEVTLYRLYSKRALVKDTVKLEYKKQLLLLCLPIPIGRMTRAAWRK